MLPWLSSGVSGTSDNQRGTVTAANGRQGRLVVYSKSRQTHSKMQTLIVQFQPRRSGELDLGRVSELMLRIALETGVGTFLIERSRARNSYLNFLFASVTAKRTWRAVQRIALNHRTLGRRLRRSTIIACQASRGWDNYRLLHHLDPNQPLDKLPGV
jgi:hypothetical protein